MTFENVADAVVAGGGVSFDAPLQPSWSLRCANTSTATGVSFERGWECHNGTQLRNNILLPRSSLSHTPLSGSSPPGTST